MFHVERHQGGRLRSFPAGRGSPALAGLCLRTQA